MDISSIFDPTKYLDFHTHRLWRKDREDILEIVSLHLGKERPHDLFTIGKHPWWTDVVLSDSEKQELSLRLSEDHCLAMGEMGLDNLKGVNMELQIEILKSQLDLAQEMQKPVIIHCVRAYDQIQQVKKQYPHLKKWCIHGYARHIILAEQLIKQGFYLSIMPSFRNQEVYFKLIKNLPIEKFFLETDSMPNVSIEEIYLQVAEIKNISVEVLKAQMMKNAIKFFGK